jgi:hypothetical protein
VNLPKDFYNPVAKGFAAGFFLAVSVILDYPKVRAVIVRAERGFGKKAGHKKLCIPANLQ